MGTDIDHLDNTISHIRHLPHYDIRGTAFFQVTVMAYVVELAVIGPIATDWSLDGEFLLQHQVPLLDNERQALELFRHTDADHDLPMHEYTILNNSNPYQENRLEGQSPRVFGCQPCLVLGAQASRLLPERARGPRSQGNTG